MNIQVYTTTKTCCDLITQTACWSGLERILATAIVLDKDITGKYVISAVCVVFYVGLWHTGNTSAEEIWTPRRPRIDTGLNSDVSRLSTWLTDRPGRTLKPSVNRAHDPCGEKHPDCDDFQRARSTALCVHNPFHLCHNNNLLMNRMRKWTLIWH